MNHTQSLLESVYKNAETGKKTLSSLMDTTKDKELSDSLRDFLRDYAEVSAKTQERVSELGISPLKGLRYTEKMMTEFSLKMNTLKDRSVAHIADMVIQGASMGVTDISKEIESCSECDEKALELAKRIREINENIIDRMKSFLSVTV